MCFAFEIAFSRGARYRATQVLRRAQMLNSNANTDGSPLISMTDPPNAHAGARSALVTPPSMLGGFSLGEKLYYVGTSQTFDDGDRVVHGEQGEVIGPFNDKRPMIKFPNNKRAIACTLDELSRSPPPPLPGGYTVGEKLYYIGSSETFESGNRVVHGEQGEVMGPSMMYEGRLMIKFPNNKGTVGCSLDALSRSPPPPLPGGYTLGEKLYFVGSSETFDDGDRVVHGEQGEVMRPGTGKWRAS